MLKFDSSVNISLESELYFQYSTPIAFIYLSIIIIICLHIELFINSSTITWFQLTIPIK